MTQKKIAIIGAGFTGLTAAYELAKKGFAVTVIERGPSIGGLAGGFTIEGAPLERAYHHLFRTDTDILNLIDELGLHEELGWFESKVAIVVPENNALMPQSSNAPIKKSIKIYPFNGVGDLLKFSPLSFVDRIRAGMVTFFLQKYTNWKTFVSVTALAWMQKWAGPNVTKVLWGPLLKGKFATFSDKVSMAWLWARIHIRANSRTSMFAKELLAYPHGGFAAIAEALVTQTEKLLDSPRNNWLLTSTNIEKVTYPNNTPTLTINGVGQAFDAVLATIPAVALQKLAPEYQPTGHINYLGAVVLTFSSEQALSDYYWHTITDTSAPFLVFLQHTNLVPKTWYSDKNVYYIGAYVPQDSPYLTTYTEDEIKEKWFTYLQQLFPTFDPAKISQITLSKFAAAQHVVDIDYVKNIPPYETGLPHTYLSNFAQIFPEDRGTNYAVREGKKIADMLTHDLLQST